ncbi:unnamed protein product [Miscanthus lutarioriparius]|uniref:Solute carrier family 35 member F1 n=1 Tax=Miscanthus lutarioriparius TaxID=422564 RepID=A0A811RWY6_9POAL|nr:unnamed protein product [Miscanthus lutarioriparius]
MEIKRDVWSLLLVLLLGQLVAFAMAASSFTSSVIANLGVDAPLTQSFFAYLLLTTVYVPIVLRRRQKLQIAWYWYLGLALVLLSDAESPEEQDPGKMPLLGDVLVIAGTVGFAFSNVGEEYCVKKKDRVEVVAMLGLFGLLISIVQILIFERKGLEAVTWSSTMINLFAGFAVAIFIFYTVTPFVLKMSGSTLFNLSLLTSDMWAVAIRVLFYQQQINWLYYLAFTVVAIGLIIYSLNDSSSDDETAASTEAPAQYQQLPIEDNSTRIGSNSGSQERTHKEEVHIC